jgi:hypothetical protein
VRCAAAASQVQAVENTIVWAASTRASGAPNGGRGVGLTDGRGLVLRLVLDPQQGAECFGRSRGLLAHAGEQFRGCLVVVTDGVFPENCAADGVGGGDSGMDGVGDRHPASLEIGVVQV